MTVSELIKELSKIPNQNLPVWTEGGYIRIGKLLFIQIGKSEEVEKMSKERCPICGYELSECQCIFGGNWHPDRTKEKEVTLHHLHLLTEAQIKHVISLEKYWCICYVDDEKNKMIENLKTKGVCKPFHFEEEAADE